MTVCEIHRRHGHWRRKAAIGALTELGTTQRTRSGGTESVKKVYGQPTFWQAWPVFEQRVSAQIGSWDIARRARWKARKRWSVASTGGVDGEEESAGVACVDSFHN